MSSNVPPAGRSKRSEQRKRSERREPQPGAFLRWLVYLLRILVRAWGGR